MALEVNGSRGEVALSIGDADIVIAATLKGLSAVSTALNCKSLADLFLRLSSVEVAATEAGIRYLTVKGDANAAIANLKLKHFEAISEAFAQILSHHFKDAEGNASSAKVEA